jgi:hypothetical protein
MTIANCRASLLPLSTLYTTRHMCHSKASQKISSELTSNSIRDLFNKKILAIRIPNFLDQNTCKVVSEKLLNAKVIQDYTNAPGIGRVGISFFEAQDSKEMESQYFAEALKNSQAIRKIFSPYQQPIDTVRVCLDEVWPEGANLRTHNGKKMFAGLCRALENGHSIIPHEDKFERDVPQDGSDKVLPENGQIAFNIYLQNPKEGGELELYTESLSTEEYDRLRGDSYGIDRDLLPAPAISLKPEEGELILFNARNLHSVSPIVGDTRLSISSFITQETENGPLKLWS